MDEDTTKNNSPSHFNTDKTPTLGNRFVRLANRLGLTVEDDPNRIERDLQALLPPREWTAFAHRLIHHGRQLCVARTPRCSRCPLSRWCPRIGVTASA